MNLQMILGLKFQDFLLRFDTLFIDIWVQDVPKISKNKNARRFIIICSDQLFSNCENFAGDPHNFKELKFSSIFHKMFISFQT